jgi:tripartite-type tricarboxylate transporter receptor subunit TctC
MVQLFRRGLPSAGLSSRSLLAVAALAAAVFTHCATAQQFPTKPVRVITPFPSGSGPDSVLRVVGDKLSRAWGQQVIVENRPGANGFIAIEAAKKAKPDGYTLVQMDDAHMALQPHLYKQIPYNVAKDFDPVATLFRTYFFVVVPAGSKWKNMSDLIAAAKAKPNDVIYGSWFIGSPGHIGAAMLEAATGTQMTHAPFKEMTQLFAAVANNEVAWSFGSAASSGPMYRAGKVKYLAVAAPKRVAGFTDVPTVAEAGGPANFDVKAWVALLAPRGTPNPIIERINADVAKALSEPDVRERLAGFGFEPFASPPGDIAKLIDTDSRRYGEIVKRAKISVD